MPTWHQSKTTGPLWHPTQWTLVLGDKPGEFLTVQRFATQQEAMDAMKTRGGYVINPASLPDTKKEPNQ